MLKKIGPYRVEERLGVGGMGEVYKAFDDRLDRWVAVKRIRPDKEEAEDNRERFLREARATAKLNHPAIVHVYDIFKDGESLCIVMEYVEGRTLDTMVLEGALESLRVARLGFEIASGLAEAHSKGIIHRDLKVENIIITPDDHAKILDFGLAKPLLSNELDTSLTGKGQLVGTSRAMSPEYVSGEEIDHRSDLFSFGVLLYEAATGHSPFKAHNTLATLKQVMVHEQTRACEINPAVPEELSDLIDRLLAKDPLDRPDSAIEVEEFLGEILGQLSSATIPRPVSSATTVTRRPTYPVPSATATAVEVLTRRRWVQLAVCLVLVAVSSIAVVSWARHKLVVEDSGADAPASWATSRKDHIVLADFVNHTGEELLDAVGLAFRLDLEQSRNPQVLSKSQVSAVLRRMERDPDTPVDIDLGLEICRREGAQALVTGSIVKIGASYRLTATAIEPFSGDPLVNESEEAESQTDILPALSEITRVVRAKLGESLVAIRETAPLEKVTTRDLEALRAYSIGVQRLEDRAWEDARDLFNRALEIDPEFAMAHAKIAGIYIDRLFDSEQGLKHLDMALASKERLTELEELYVEGWVARLRGTPDQVIRRWELMTTLFPEEIDGHLNVAKANLFLFNRYEEAEASYREAIELAGPEASQNFFRSMGGVQLALGQYEEAYSNLKKTGAEVLLRDYYLVARETETLEDLRAEVSPEDARSLTLQQWLISYYCDRGDLEKALDLAKSFSSPSGQADTEKSTANLLSLASVLEQMGRTEELEAQLDRDLPRIANLVEKELQRIATGQSNESEVRGGIYILPFTNWALLTKIGFRSSSSELPERIAGLLVRLAESRQLPIWLAHAKMLEGEALAAKGNLSGGIMKLRESIADAEFSQAHESMARIYTKLGEIDQAKREFQWLIDHRSRSYMECFSGCRPMALIDWNYAFLHLGELYLETGEPEQARALLQSFLDHWPAGSELGSSRKARARLDSTGPSSAGGSGASVSVY